MPEQPKGIPQVPPQIVLTLRPNGDVEVRGPLDNKQLCVHMLTQAIRVVTVWKGQEQKRIIVPTMAVPQDVVKPRRG